MDKNEIIFDDLFNEAIHWDTVLTKPFSLNKDITLYHFSNKKLDILKPIGMNVGNKIARKPRRSVWFTDHKEDWILPIQAFLKFNYKEYWKKDLFWKWNKDITLKNSDGTYGATLILTKEFYEKFKNEIDNFKIYRYTKTFKIKELGRGTEPTIPEWTYDEEVVPDKVDVKTGKDLINMKLIEIVTAETINSWIEKYNELKKKIGHSMIFPELIDYKVEWWKYDSKTYKDKRKAAEEKMGVLSYKDLHLKETNESYETLFETAILEKRGVANIKQWETTEEYNLRRKQQEYMIKNNMKKRQGDSNRIETNHNPIPKTYSKKPGNPGCQDYTIEENDDPRTWGNYKKKY